MMRAADWSERLQRQFRRPLPLAAAEGPCPPSDEVRLAAEGGLAAAALERLVDHAAACPACTLAWRLVRADAEALTAPASVPVTGRFPRAVWGRRLWQVAALIAAAALATAAVARWGLWPPAGPVVSPGDPGVWRGGIDDAPRSLIGDGTTLGREDLSLRWSAAPAGSRYRVVVTDEDLAPLWAAEALREPGATIPAAAVSDLPAGRRLLWRVEAVLPDGRRLTSPAYVLILG